MNHSSELPLDFEPLSIAAAPEGSKPVLENIQQRLGFIPNLMGVFAHSPAVLKGFLALNAEWEKSGFCPQERQLVLLAGSLENDCAYAVAAHSTNAKGSLKVPAETVDAIRRNVATGDERLDALVALTRELIKERGHAKPATIQRFLAAGFAEEQVMELLLAIGLKAMNYNEHFSPVPLDAQYAAEKY